MVEPGVLETMKTQVEQEIQANSTEHNEEYPFFGYFNNFYGLFVNGHKKSRDLIEGTKWMTSERRRLYQLADESLAIEGIQIQKVNEYVQLMHQNWNPDDNYSVYMGYLEEMNKMLFPVYVRLRALGFPHYPDLTA